MKRPALRTKLSAFAIAVISFLTLPLIIYSHYQQQQLLLSKFEKQEIAFIEGLAPGALAALEHGVYTDFSEHIKKKAARRDVSAFELNDATGGVVARAASPRATGDHRVALDIYGAGVEQRFEIRQGREGPSTTYGKKVGTLVIYFSEKLKERELTRLAIESSLLLLIVILTTAASLFLIDRYLIKRIQEIRAGLLGLREGNYRPNLRDKAPDELGELAQLVNDMGVALENDSDARRMERDQIIADQAASIDREIRANLAVLRSTESARKCLRDAFEASARLPCPNRNEKLNLSTLLMEAILSIDEISIALAIDDWKHRRETRPVRVWELCESITAAANLLRRTKGYRLDIVIDDELSHSDEYVFIDARIVARLLVLSMEHWAKNASVFSMVWALHLYLFRSPDNTTAFCLGLTADAGNFDHEKALEFGKQSFAKEAVGTTVPGSLGDTIRQLCEAHNIAHAITLKSGRQFSITFSIENCAVKSQKPQPYKSSLPTKSGKRVLLLGSSRFTSPLQDKLSFLSTECISLTFRELEMLDISSLTRIGLTIFDGAAMASHLITGEEVPAYLRKINEISGSLTVAVIDNPQTDALGLDETLFGSTLQVDQVLRGPLSSGDIVRLCSALTSEDIVKTCIGDLVSC